jgi:hypothetical protein
MPNGGNESPVVRRLGLRVACDMGMDATLLVHPIKE